MRLLLVAKRTLGSRDLCRPMCRDRVMCPRLAAQVAAKWLRACGRIPPKCPSACGRSLSEIVSLARRKCPRNGPYCMAQVSPEGIPLCGPSNPEISFSLRPKSPRNGLHPVAQVSANWSPTCGRVHAKSSFSVWPKSSRNVFIVWPKSGNGSHLEAQVSPVLFPPCGPSIPEVSPNAWPKAPRNGPRCAARVSPNWSLLCGPSLSEMANLASRVFPKWVFATWSKAFGMVFTVWSKPPRTDPYRMAPDSPK